MTEINCNSKVLDFAYSHVNLNGYFEFYGRKIRYDKFFSLVRRISFNLADFGIKRGDTVTLMLPNCPQFAMLVYALSNVGAICSLISPLISKTHLKETMERTNSKILFVSTITDYSFDKIKVIRVNFGYYMGFPTKFAFLKKKSTSGVRFEDFLENDICDQNKKVSFEKDFDSVSPDDVAFYLNSGGTTGEPKTVMISQSALNYCSYCIMSNLLENGYSLNSGVNSIFTLPMFYGYGLSVLHTSITMSFNQCVRAKFRPKDFARDICWNHSEIMFGVPVIYKKLLSTGKFNSSKCKELKVCYSGGEKLSENLQNEFYQAFPDSIILEGYGLSEAVAPFVSSSKVYNAKGSCGRVCSLLKIEAFEGENQLPRGNDGEICVCTKAMMKGYYNDPENTAKVIFVKNGEKWLRTGDFGKIDKDGFVFLSGRIKNIIKRKGVNIFPSEIETCLLKIDFIKDAVVFGYKDKDEIERIVCAVVLKDNNIKDVEKKIKEHVKKELSVLSCPEYVLVKEKFILTAVGKINTILLKEEIKNKYGL